VRQGQQVLLALFLDRQDPRAQEQQGQLVQLAQFLAQLDLKVQEVQLVLKDM
jgi:hypothetical protein